MSDRSVTEEVKNGDAGSRTRAGTRRRTFSNRERREPAIARRGAARAPLSFEQRRLWFLDRLCPDCAAYTMPLAFELRGTLDVTALEAAMRRLVERHEILRTRFVSEGGDAVQVVGEAGNFKLARVELNAVSEDAVRQRLQIEAARPFNLSSDLMFRATMFRLQPDRHLLLLNIHHVASDAWSWTVLLRELGVLYRAELAGQEPALAPLPIQYSDYARWQQEESRSGKLAEQVNYWRGQLAGAPALLELPADRRRPAKQTFRGGSETVRVPSGLKRRLETLAAREGVTMHLLLLTAFAALLHRYSHRDDLIIGTPMTGRTEVELEGLIGFFVRTLVVRADASGAPDFRELLRRIKHVMFEAYAHQDVPFEKLIEELRPARSPAFPPLVQVMFAYQDASPSALDLPGIDAAPIKLETQTAKFDLTLFAESEGDTLELAAEYNADLFEPPTIARLLAHLNALLEAVAGDPGRGVGDLPLLSDAELRRQLGEWNKTARPFPRDQSVAQLFGEQAARTPRAVAVRCGRDELTYRELDEQSNQLARHLSGLGAGPGSLVAVALDRSLELIVALAGILKSGAAYVALDPTHPPARLAATLADAKAAILVTTEARQTLFRQAAAQPRLVRVDADARAIRQCKKTSLGETIDPESPAYVCFTSGSTGGPKGVCIPHRGVARLVMNTDYLQLGPGDVVTQMSNVAFDASTFEIWGALLNGARLEVIPSPLALTPRELRRELERRGITTMFVTTALFNQLAQEDPAIFAGVRNVLFGGDAVNPACVAEVLNSRPPRRLLHVYGPTECTTFATWHEVKAVDLRENTIPIGRPVANTSAYVLDERQRPVPPGVMGELYVGGDGLATGYLNRPELTAERFVAVPAVAPGGRLYRTGDLVRQRADGSLEFIGRADLQVKIRGFRVELGEIEAALARHPGVQEGAVSVWTPPKGDKRVVAHVVLNNSAACTVEELRAFLRTLLPDYMVPSDFVFIPSLPLNANGKVDRGTLKVPAAVRGPARDHYLPPRDETETQVAAIWEEHLGVRPIGALDNFFDLGGHSLLAIRVLARVEKDLGRSVAVSTLFESPTLGEFARALRASEPVKLGSHTSLVAIQPLGSRAPLYLVHGAGGGMFWGYANLARLLGNDQPVYAFRSRSVAGQKEFATIEELAAHYVEDLRAFQPRGPYLLGGYCFGGNVAYEMAQRLRAQGEEVALLALMNSIPPRSRYWKPEWSPRWARKFVGNLGYLLRWHFQRTESQRREFVAWKMNTLAGRLARWIGPKREAPPKVTDLVDLSGSLPEERPVWDAHVKALFHYETKPYAGRVMLLRSPGHHFWCSFDDAYGWREFVADGLDVQTVAGAHEQILEEPFVRAMASALKLGLEKVEAREQARRAERDEARHDFWRRALRNPPGAIDLPADRPRGQRLEHRPAEVPVEFADSLAERIEEFASGQRTSAEAVLMAGIAAVLGRYSGAGELLISLPEREPGRGPAEKRRFRFARAKLPDGVTFRRLVADLGRALTESKRIGGLDAEEFERVTGKPAGGDSPVAQIAFEWCEPGASSTVPAGEREEIAFLLRREGHRITGTVRYEESLFDADRIARLAGHCEVLLRAALAAPDQEIASLPLLPERERRQVVTEWNQTALAVPEDATLISLFERQVRRSPGAIALVDGHERMDYRTLDEQAERLARRLRRLGVRPETLVGVCVERSWRMVASILAILKAGGGYVPLDPAYPRDRLEFMLDDSRAKVVITQRNLRHIFPEGTSRELLCVDGDWKEFDDAATEQPAGAAPTNLAYVIYTSGSTGKPKGVAIEHRAPVTLMHWARNVFLPGEIAGILAATSICFDLSVFEMFVPLSWGGKIILANNVLSLPSLPAAGELTLVNTVPSAMRELLRIKGVPPSVRVVNLAGEPLTAALADQIYQDTAVEKVYDLYGPSETTTYSTGILRAPGGPATIGRPLANEQVYILDDRLQPVPVGVPGLLYIGGAGLSRGYLHRPELTAEKFIAHPFEPGKKVYNTGDLARWRNDGTIEFLGRADHQVKVRGFRIELGEIETALRKHEALSEAVVIAREFAEGDKRLAAYLVARNGVQPAAEALRAFLKGSLPEYMVPSAFHYLAGLPRTPSGKVDRQKIVALKPADTRAPAQGDPGDPRTEMERALAAIWCEVLRRDSVGMRDNFFDLGGHSLLAVQVISRVRERFQRELPLSSLFEHPTIAQLAEALGKAGGTEDALPPLRAGATGGPAPVSFVQERLWVLDQMQPGSAAYHVPIALRIRGALNVALLERALDEIVRRHDALRTAFGFENGQLAQSVREPFGLRLEKTDLRAVPRAQRNERERLRQFAARPFDLAHGPLIRGWLATLAEDEFLLEIVLHHAVSDGWSLAVLFSELEQIYEAFGAGSAHAGLPRLEIQYPEFSRWQRETFTDARLAGDVAWWERTLHGAPPSIRLPRDAAPGEPARALGRAALPLSGAATAAVHAFARQAKVTPFMTFLAALAITLRQWTRQEDMVIGTVVAGRNRRELENLIGCFMNFLPLRVRAAGSETANDFIARVRATVIEAQAHENCPFQKIVEAVNPRRSTDQNPLYNVGLLLQNFPESLFHPAGIESRVETVEPSEPLLDLRFEVEERRGEFAITCEYKAALFGGQTIAELLRSFQAVLETLISNPPAALASFEVSEGLRRQAAATEAKEAVVVSSTFTPDFLGEPLRYWLKELRLNAEVRFVPYGQIFQQLLQPDDSFADARGLNVILLRLEDWEANWIAGCDPAEPVEQLPRSFEEFALALQSAAARPGRPYLVCLCPSSKMLAARPDHTRWLESVEQTFAGRLRAVAGVRVLTPRELLELYPVSRCYDAVTDELGHVPYTPEFFAALGTAVARHYHGLRRTPCKVIALDCDQTLWSGICGEDGVDGVELDEPRRRLQEFMLRQMQAGRLLCLCSKNNEADVDAVFNRFAGGPLRPEHFAARRINWQPKSANLRALAEELNVGLNSFVFLDDNPAECAEVRANCPEVVTLQLPEDPGEIEDFVRHCWVFDQFSQTAEDAERTRMYRQNRQREALRRETVTFDDFLAALQLRIEIGGFQAEDVARISQLTLRTNQFNTTTLRRNEGEIQALANAGYNIETVRVADRFGDYGLVGVVISKATEQSLEVESFMLSCRVLGKGVEHRVLAHLAGAARSRSLPAVSVRFTPTEKNKPAQEFLESAGAGFFRPEAGGYVIPVNVAAGARPKVASASPVAGASGRLVTVEAAEAPGYDRWEWIAAHANDPGKILALVEATAPVRSRTTADGAPSTAMERQLCGLWQEVLRLERVGIHDDFFDLGGGSLLAVRLFARIENATGKRLPVVAIFQYPTVAQLAEQLERTPAAEKSSPLIVPIQPNGTRLPLFMVHGAGGDGMWGYANLAGYLGMDQPVYGIQPRPTDRPDKFDRLESMAADYVKELRAFRPNGPYCLGGYCFGGNLAYEMARQLALDGQEVAFVGLLESAPEGGTYRKPQWWRPGFPLRFVRNTRYCLADFMGYTPEERKSLVRRKLAVLSRKLRDRVAPRGRADVDLDDIIDCSKFSSQEIELWQAHLRLLVNHTSKAYPGTVTAFRTRAHPLFSSYENDMGWGALTRGVEVRVVAGSHGNIFMEPNVRDLAEKLSASLNQLAIGNNNKGKQV